MVGFAACAQRYSLERERAGVRCCSVVAPCSVSYLHSQRMADLSAAYCHRHRSSDCNRPDILAKAACHARWMAKKVAGLPKGVDLEIRLAGTGEGISPSAISKVEVRLLRFHGRRQHHGGTRQTSLLLASPSQPVTFVQVLSGFGKISVDSATATSCE